MYLSKAEKNNKLIQWYIINKNTDFLFEKYILRNLLKCI